MSRGEVCLEKFYSKRRKWLFWEMNFGTNWKSIGYLNFHHNGVFSLLRDIIILSLGSYILFNIYNSSSSSTPPSILKFDKTRSYDYIYFDEKLKQIFLSQSFFHCILPFFFSFIFLNLPLTDAQWNVIKLILILIFSNFSFSFFRNNYIFTFAQVRELI